MKMVYNGKTESKNPREGAGGLNKGEHQNTVDFLGILADIMATQNTQISCFLVSWRRFISTIDSHITTLVFSNLDGKLLTVVATKVHAQVM